MHADARQTDFCVYLSAILLGGLLLNAVLGWWWADPISALIMVPVFPTSVSQRTISVQYIDTANLKKLLGATRDAACDVGEPESIVDPPPSGTFDVRPKRCRPISVNAHPSLCLSVVPAPRLHKMNALRRDRNLVHNSVHTHLTSPPNS